MRLLAERLIRGGGGGGDEHGSLKDGVKTNFDGTNVASQKAKFVLSSFLSPVNVVYE